MARPQIEDGFAMLALELLAALAVADFNKHEAMVLSLIFAAQYGPEKQAGVALDAVSMGAASGSDPSRFRRALKDLKAAGVIVEAGRAVYAFSKDWESWAGKSGPRVDHGDRDFVAYMTGRFGTRNPSTNKRKCRATEPDPKELVRATEPDPKELVRATEPGTDVDENYKRLSANGHAITISDAALAGWRARPAEDRKTREKKIDISSSTTTTQRAGARPSSSSELADWVSESIEDARSVRPHLAGWVEAYGVSDTFDALMHARINRPGRVAPYVDGTLRNWHAEGKLPSRRAAGSPAGNPAAGCRGPATLDRTEAKRQKFRDGIAAWKARNREEAERGDRA